MILTLSDKLDASSSRTLSENELIGLVAAATGVVLGAYDGEGYIRWSRNRK